MERNLLNRNGARVPNPPGNLQFDDEDLLLYFIARHYQIIAILIEGTWNAFKMIFNKVSMTNASDFFKEFICMVLFVFFVLAGEIISFLKACLPSLFARTVSLLKRCFCYSSLIKVANWSLYLSLVFIMFSRACFFGILRIVREVIDFRNRWLQLFDIVSLDEVSGALGRFGEVIELFEENSSTNPLQMIFVCRLFDLCRSCLKLLWAKLFLEVAWRVALNARGSYIRIRNFVMTAYDVDENGF
ncbi:hypothetical protein AVEN_195066-1 [Araneus ventricosus]|uniref:Uncharacterized protein n=1 Tax=Araneus ventricosus TaxID=182803 RepID=A0A4Y2BGH6_ARAVE|nr:hypothetical protein AVEN_195066-1 [Araneus ventricosus]